MTDLPPLTGLIECFSMKPNLFRVLLITQWNILKVILASFIFLFFFYYWKSRDLHDTDLELTSLQINLRKTL